MNALEEQIRLVDRVVKDFDLTRKQLEQLVRKVDDLYDEVKHFKDFLQYEKQHRDPSLSSARSATPGSGPGGSSLDHVIETLSSLTIQLCKEWDEKLESIRTCDMHQQTSQSATHN